MSDLGFPEADYEARLERARAAMAERGIDAMALSVGSDLPYLTGYEAMPLERLTLGILRAEGGPIRIVIPRLEAARVPDRPGVVTVEPWDETDDPIALSSELMAGATKVAVGAQMWSRFLLQLEESMGSTSFVDATGVMSSLRIIKDPIEIEMLRLAGAAVDRVVAQLADVRFSGRTERDLAAEVSARTVAEGHQIATFHIVASGPNGASPHHEPGDRLISTGDTVVVDFGGRLGGYCSDTTRTFHVGVPDSEASEVHGVVHAAQQAGVAAVRPGITGEELDRVARKVIDDAGYGEYFFHRLGHGIGLDGHEDPYLVSGNDVPLEPGMAFSIEPGIYLAGRFGVRIEDIVVCGDSAADNLNNSNRALVSVE